jgi:SAM-dependent MidA family methyltransferase
MAVFSSADVIAHLPAPPAAAIPHSRALQAEIQALIAQQPQQRITFQQFMQYALYKPQRGYYMNGLQKFGKEGDFITAPELSPVFGCCVAQQCHAVLQALGGGDILEFGAGSGALVTSVLGELARLACLPEHYFILEPSAELRHRQQQTLQTQPWFDRLVWLTQLPRSIRGLVLANEVLDAMPVQCFRVEANGASLLMVENHGDALHANWYASDGGLPDFISDLPVGYGSEFNPQLNAWVQTVADMLTAGLVLLIDYGFPRAEYYHLQRDQGTLMCFYQHRTHANPLIHIGLQDITAHVDFTAVAEAADQAGLMVAGFTSQAQFLLANGLEHYFAQAQTAPLSQRIQLNTEIKKLLLPEEMGELFKVMALSRDLTVPLAGFTHDRRRAL